VSLVDDELRGIARRIAKRKHNERPPGATGLVHEDMPRLLEKLLAFDEIAKA